MLDHDDPHDLDLEPGVAAAEEAAGSRSVLDRVKARREARTDTLTLDIPTWNGELRATYQVIDRADLDKMVKKIRARQAGSQSESSVGVEVDLDFLIKACVKVEAVDAETDEKEELTPGYTTALADLLDRPEGSESARGLVLYLTGKRDENGNVTPNGIAVAAHAMKVARWMQDPSKPVDQDPQ